MRMEDVVPTCATTDKTVGVAAEGAKGPPPAGEKMLGSDVVGEGEVVGDAVVVGEVGGGASVMGETGASGETAGAGAKGRRDLTRARWGACGNATVVDQAGADGVGRP